MRTLKLFVPLVLVWTGLSAAAPVRAQCPAKTVVQDTLLNADGSPASGRVVVSWPTFLSGSCQVIAGQVSVGVTSGALSVELFPNEGAVPAGTSYRVTYYLKSGRVSTEYWVVPDSATPVALSVVRSASIPVPTMMFSQGQVTNLVSDLSRKVELPSPCAAGKFLQSTGSAQVSCVDGTGAPLATQTQSGTVKTDVSDPDPRVYLQSTTDTLLAGKAALSHIHAIADVTSLQASLDAKQAQDADLDALAALSGTGYVRRTGAATFVVTSASGTGACPANQVAIQLNDAAAPTCVALSAGYIPSLDASKIASGTLASARLPNPAVGAKGGVEAKTCTGTDKLSAIGVDGVPVCSADETSGGGSGITSLGSQTGATQTFSKQDDTNVTLTIASATNNHDFAMGWTGQLAITRGGTGASTAGAAFDALAPPTTRGDLIRRGASANERLALGTTGKYLKSDGTDALWSDGAASGTGGCTNQFVRTLNSDAAPTCASVATADITDANVTPAKVSDPLKTRQVVFILGADNGSALADTDDQATIYRNTLGVNFTITQVWCQSDGGTPRVQLQRADGTPASILTDNSGAGVDCSTSGATGTLDATEKVINDGHNIHYLTVTAGGTAKRITIVITGVIG